MVKEDRELDWIKKLPVGSLISFSKDTHVCFDRADDSMLTQRRRETFIEKNMPVVFLGWKEQTGTHRMVLISLLYKSFVWDAIVQISAPEWDLETYAFYLTGGVVLLADITVLSD